MLIVRLGDTWIATSHIYRYRHTTNHTVHHITNGTEPREKVFVCADHTHHITTISGINQSNKIYNRLYKMSPSLNFSLWASTSPFGVTLSWAVEWGWSRFDEYGERPVVGWGEQTYIEPRGGGLAGFLSGDGFGQSCLEGVTAGESRFVECGLGRMMEWGKLAAGFLGGGMELLSGLGLQQSAVQVLPQA